MAAADWWTSANSAVGGGAGGGVINRRRDSAARHPRRSQAIGLQMAERQGAALRGSGEDGETLRPSHYRASGGQQQHAVARSLKDDRGFQHVLPRRHLRSSFGGGGVMAD